MPLRAVQFTDRGVDSMIRYTWIVRDRRLVFFQHPVQGGLYPRMGAILDEVREACKEFIDKTSRRFGASQKWRIAESDYFS